MTTPVFRSASATTVQGSGTTSTVPFPSGAVANDLIIEALAVGSNVDSTKTPSFNLLFEAPSALSRPSLMVAWKRFVSGESGDPTPGTNQYVMTTGSGAAANSGAAFRFDTVIGAGSPFGPTAFATAAAGSTSTGVTLANGQYTPDDLLLLFVALNSSRTLTGPAGWTPIHTTTPAGLFGFVMTAPASGDVVVPGMAISGGTAQSLAFITSIKKPSAVAFPATSIGGSLFATSTKAEMENGTAHPLTFEGVVIGGTTQPIV